MKKILTVLLCLGLVGCAVTVSNIRKYELPPDYKAEVEDILNHFKNNFPLHYNYSIEILSEKEMNETMKSGSPHIREVSPAGLSTIYIDDLFIKYLYQNPYIYVYRKLYLVCIVAHEICHREYDLPASPIGAHLQVDYKAIDMVKKFGIEWFEYTWALASTDNYLGIRKSGGEWQNLFGIILQGGVAVSTGFLYQENDLFSRAIMINNDLGRIDKGWSGKRGKRWRSFIDNKKVWDFPVGYNSTKDRPFAEAYGGKIFSMIGYTSEDAALKALDDFAAGRQNFNGQTFSLDSLPENSSVKSILESLQNGSLTVPLKSDADGLYYIYWRIQ